MLNAIELILIKSAMVTNDVCSIFAVNAVNNRGFVFRIDIACQIARNEVYPISSDLIVLQVFIFF